MSNFRNHEELRIRTPSKDYKKPVVRGRPIHRKGIIIMIAQIAKSGKSNLCLAELKSKIMFFPISPGFSSKSPVICRG